MPLDLGREESVVSMTTRSGDIRKSALLAGAMVLCAQFLFAAAASAVPMWKEAKRWQCNQAEFEAACGGRYDKECRVQEPRKLQNLTFDFGENMVIMDDGLGISYIPITARTVDRRGEISTILYGEAGNIVLQYSGGQAVTMAMPVGGGSVAIQFFACEALPHE